MKYLKAWTVLAVLLVASVSADAQISGGIFNPLADYTIGGSWTFQGTNSYSGSQTFSGATTFSGVATFSANPVITAITKGAATLTLPSTTGGMPTVYSCGATTGAASCVTSQTGSTAMLVVGKATLSVGSATVDTFPHAWTASDSFSCQGIDNSSGSGVLARIVNTSTQKITFSGTGSGTVFYICGGY